MGSNWGIALGAGVQSALQMYGAIQAGQRNALEIEKMEKEKADTAALDKAWAESQARVGQQDEYSQAIKTAGGLSSQGTQQAKMLSDQGALPGNTPEDQAFEKANAQSVAGTLRENAVRQGAIPQSQAAVPEVKPTEYTSKQAMSDYVKAAGQVSRKGALEAIQMKGVMRESEIQDKFDTEMGKLNDVLGRIHGTAETGGLKGLAEAANKEGLNVKFVEGKNGVGSRIQVLGPKGDVIETVSDIGSATQKLSDAAMQQFMHKGVGLLGSFDKVAAYMQGERKINIQEKEATDRGRYYDAYADYLKTGGKGGKESVKSRAYEYGDLMFEAGEKNPQTGKPFANQAEARKYALGIALKAPEAKGITANPDGSVIQNGILYVPDPKTPGKFIPATGLPNSPRNSVVSAFANYDPNQKSGQRTALPAPAVRDDTNP